MALVLIKARWCRDCGMDLSLSHDEPFLISDEIALCDICTEKMEFLGQTKAELERHVELEKRMKELLCKYDELESERDEIDSQIRWVEREIRNLEKLGIRADA